MLTLEQLKRGAAVVADTALKTGTELAEKGKRQVDLMALRTKLSRTQRELGALVYSLHKNGEENPELVEKYIQAVEAVEQELAAYTPDISDEANDADVRALCPSCGAEVDPAATFCRVCGYKL